MKVAGTFTRSLALAGVAISLTSLPACSGSSSSKSSATTASTTVGATATAAQTTTTTAAGGPGDQIRVPFGGDPCASLTSAELTTLGLPSSQFPAKPKTDLLSFQKLVPPAKNNTCSWGPLLVTYLPKNEFDNVRKTNSGSSSDTLPPGMPAGSFVSDIGDLYISAGGYYLSVPSHGPYDAAAKVVAAKL